MKALIVVIIVIGLILLFVGCKKQDATSKLQESSMNFDIDTLQPFLERVANLIQEGFGEKEIANIMTSVKNMEPDEENNFNFEILYQQKKTPFIINVFMDDIDAPDVFFFSPADLANQIDNEMADFAEELGI